MFFSYLCLLGLLKKYLDALADNGGIYNFSGKLNRFDSSDNNPKPGPDGFKTEVILKSGIQVTFSEWVETIPGLKVYSGMGGNFFKVEKTTKDIEVPELELVEYEKGTPPFRIFRVK